MEKDEQGAPDLKTDANTGGEGASKPTGLKGTRSLRKLRDRVERAANELIRLRSENQLLQERIEELEAMPATNDDAGGLVLDGNPEALKRKVEGFIQAIDDYLEEKEPLS